VAYAGVPFKSLFVNMTALQNRATVSLLDDYENNYPLRGDLGDRPDEWLELRGRGTARVRYSRRLMPSFGMAGLSWKGSQRTLTCRPRAATAFSSRRLPM
jgi:hypothetical protein